MNKLQVFCYQGNEVRTVEVNGEPWFVLKDVCAVLGLSTPARVAERLDPDEVSQTHLTDSLGREQETTIVNESGLYHVLLRSDKPEAKPLRKWVTSEVLPSIRKTGSYNQKHLSPVEMFAMQAQINLEQERRLAAVENRQDELILQVQHNSDTMDKVTAAYTAPLASGETWQESANRTVNSLVEQYGLNHQNFRRDIYAELEFTAGVDLQQRVTRLQSRMKANGATVTQCRAASKLTVIAQDKKLRAIFDGILRRRALKLSAAREQA